ncbi:DUF4249 family protein [Aquimarina sp. RZ0]|uniref:DUF4249 family protein n=1 Tax=Aquimarina sp. RZ0 TaxID=2607730 RepID=UPI0011F0FC55|nr:DUF4249 family protein [Aquimarina sp. RZ0]KAA1243415.1 DUF4249 domain-containing protein [Aquimarina sp. RZ0]
MKPVLLGLSKKTLKKQQMRYFNFLVLMTLSIVCSNCETNIDASDLLDQQQLVVINGYLSPQDTLLKVQISKSKSRADSRETTIEDLAIKNAIVVIKDENDNEVSLTYSSVSFSYEAPANDLPILAGNTYFLTAMVDGNEYKSSCMIPVNKVQNIESDIKDEPGGGEFGRRILNLKIEDIKDERNFYITGGTITHNFIDDGISVRDLDFDFEHFATDSNRENAIIALEGFFTILSNPVSETPKINLKITNNEQILYDALRADFFNDYNDGDPFFEPIIAPTNIEGENGFGVFAGYQITEIEIDAM